MSHQPPISPPFTTPHRPQNRDIGERFTESQANPNPASYGSGASPGYTEDRQWGSDRHHYDSGGSSGGSGGDSGGTYGGAYGGANGNGSGGASGGASGGGPGGAYGGGPGGAYGAVNGGFNGGGPGGASGGGERRYQPHTMPIKPQEGYRQYYSQLESPDHERDEDPSQRPHTEMVGDNNYKSARILATVPAVSQPPPHMDTSRRDPEENSTKEHKYTQPLAVIGVPSRGIMSNHPTYHGKMTGIDAEEKLRKMDEPCYLTRFSEIQKRYVLSLMKKGKNDFVHLPLTIDNENNKYEIEGTDNSFRTVSNMLKHYEHYSPDPTIPSIGRPCFVEEVMENAQDPRHIMKKKRLSSHREEDEEDEDEACGSAKAKKNQEQHLMETMQKMLEGAMIKAQKEAKVQDQQGPDFQQMFAEQQERIEVLAEQNRQLLARLPPEDPPQPQPDPEPAPPQPQPEPPEARADPPPAQRRAENQQRNKKCPIL